MTETRTETGTPFSDSPIHTFDPPDQDAIDHEEADPDRCNACGETEDHWKHHVPDDERDHAETLPGQPGHDTSWIDKHPELSDRKDH